MSWETPDPPDSQVLLKPGESVLVVGIPSEPAKSPERTIRLSLYYQGVPVRSFTMRSPINLGAELPFGLELRAEWV